MQEQKAREISQSSKLTAVLESRTDGEEILIAKP